MANTSFIETANNFFQAIDFITSKQVNKMEFDKTLLCTIEEVTNSQKGIYKVTDGVSHFTAYSENTDYKEGTRIYVKILNGDMTGQKIITGKYISDETDYIYYTSPLNNFIDVSGNLIEYPIDKGLIANKKEQKEIVLWEYFLEEEKYIKGYERLGLQAEFKTLLDKRIFRGSYGIRLEVAEKTNTGLGKIHSYFLDAKDMYGNPYNFTSYYSQEILFDISDLYEIVGLRLSFYQNNDFILNTGEILPTENYINLFIQNPYISFGYASETFNEDKVVLGTYNNITYSTQDEMPKRKIYMRWIHKQGERMYSIDNFNELPENALIHWYRYKIAQSRKDELAGAFWQEFSPGEDLFNYIFFPDYNSDEDKFKVIIEYPSRASVSKLLETNNSINEIIYNFDSISSSEKEDIKKLCSITDLNELSKHYSYLRNYYSQNDSVLEGLGNIYSIVLEERNKIKFYTSEILTFTNEITQTDEAIDLIRSLSIDIDIENYNGVYRLYNSTNHIINPLEASKLRTLNASYNSIITNENELSSAEEITWYFPINNTMIMAPVEGKEYSLDNEDIYIPLEESDKEGYVAIRRYGVDTIEKLENGIRLIETQQSFRIKDYYNQSASNNTIYCTVKKRGKIYEAFGTLLFGPAATKDNAIICNLNLYSCDENNNPIDRIPAITKGKKAIIIPEVFDYNNQPVELSSMEIKYFWQQEGKNNAISLQSIGNNAILNSQNIEMSNYCFYILRAEIILIPKNIFDGSSKEIKLISYLPIAVRINENYDEIQGPTKIIYNKQGIEPDYYKEPFKLFDKNNKTYNINWYSYSSDFEGKSGNDLIRVQNFYPKVALSGEFAPKLMFYSGLEPYGVFAGNNNIINEAVWIQPIIILQNQNYSYSVLQDWDGNLTIDEENGIILSTMVGAGIKNTDNTFSGVLMGDVVNTTTNKSDGVGLYGYHHGNKSFGFNVDGTAFIGFGDSKITFNGQNGEIVGNTIIGSEINNGNGTFKVDANGNLTASNVNITGGAVDIANNFIVESNGNVTIKQGNVNITTGNIDLGNGNFEVSNDGIVTIKSGSINIADKFKVNTNGNMEATNAKITGTITGSTISGGTISGTEITGGTISIGNNFIVDGNGKVQIKNGSITMSNGDESENGKIVFSVNEDGYLNCTGATFDRVNITRATISSQGNVRCSGLTINGLEYTPHTIYGRFMIVRDNLPQDCKLVPYTAVERSYKGSINTSGANYQNTVGSCSITIDGTTYYGVTSLPAHTHTYYYYDTTIAEQSCIEVRHALLNNISYLATGDIQAEE